MSKIITGKVLSVQLGREETRLVLLNDGAQILHAASMATPAGAVEDGMIRNPDAIREMLKGVRKDPAFQKVRKVVFALCTSQVITEVVTIPDLPKAKLGKLLKANADMYFPVDTQDHQMVWQVIEPKVTDGIKELSVRLWAVPKAMLTHYYKVANACGFSVAAIDYCGHSMATLAGATFATPGKAAKERKKLNLNQDISFGRKKAEEPALVQQTVPAGEKATQVYLHLDRDLMGMTFVQYGQVVMQRIIPCGNNPASQFGELSMMLEYFRSTESGRGSTLSGIVTGQYAQDRQMVGELADMLDIPVAAQEVPYDLQWCLCVAAAETDMEFGNPMLDAPDKTRKQVRSSLWQYALVMLALLALGGVMLHLMTARLGWQAEIAQLQSEQQAVAIQMQQSAGFADNYHAYKADYDHYSNDWDTVFASLQTYNDNLVLVLDELETILPENASVAGMQIGASGLNVTFACEDKEEAAYLIMALRDMQYADLMAVSDMEGGGKGPATEYGPETGEEAPEEGGSDLSEEQRLALETAISADLNPYALGYHLGMGHKVKNNHVAKLQDSYSITPANKHINLKHLMEDASVKLTYAQRAYAFYLLCTTNPMAMGTAEEMIVNDMQNGGTLYRYILDGVRKAGQSPLNVTKHTSVEDLQADVELLVDTIITYNSEYPALDYAEQMLTQNPVAEAWYLYYLESLIYREADPNLPSDALIQPEEEIWWEYYQQVKLTPDDETLVPPILTPVPYLNMDKVIDDLMNKQFDSRYSALNEVLNSLLSANTLALLDECGAVAPLPTFPTEPSTTPTEPQETQPSTTPSTPGGNSEYEALVAIYLPAYLRTGKINFPGASAYVPTIDKYFKEGKTGTQYDAAIDSYITAGNVDEVLMELMVQYKGDPNALENKAVKQMFDNFYKNSDTGNAALNAHLAKLEKTLQGETTEGVTAWLKSYMTTGKTGTEAGDLVIRKYLETGSTDDEAQTKALNDYVAGGNVDRETKTLLYYYLYKKSAIKDASIVKMFDNYYGGSTGSRALDDRIRDLGKVIASEAINNAGQSGGGSSGGGGGSSGGGGGGGSSKPKDTRVYFAVILNYNEELRTAELDRKGLDYKEKIGELEVGE
ncbi:MAG: pilus assembly protein PilM [Oscillospiraceae bacterium]|nr:pilus assembly protein PilM [Oscillospiraceae bacterium]